MLACKDDELHMASNATEKPKVSQVAAAYSQTGRAMWQESAAYSQTGRAMWHIVVAYL